MPLTKVVAEAVGLGVAQRLTTILGELLEPAPEAVTMFEHGPKCWRVEAYFSSRLDPQRFRTGIEALAGHALPTFTWEEVPELNWVAISQAALPPVAAGRFTVHGSHDRGRVAPGPNAILIDAGEAFGTAHHATTSGCLLAIDRLTRRRSFRNVLDLGCGSGVLAIAVARVQPAARIIATDIDPVAVEVARANMRRNGVSGRIAALTATGLDHARLRRAPAFDLVIANILAGPLVALARHIARRAAPGSNIVLSGLLVHQAPAVLAAYRAQGFSLVAHQRVVGWSTLTLVLAGNRCSRR